MWVNDWWTILKFVCLKWWYNWNNYKTEKLRNYNFSIFEGEILKFPEDFYWLMSKLMLNPFLTWGTSGRKAVFQVIDMIWVIIFYFTIKISCSCTWNLRDLSLNLRCNIMHWIQYKIKVNVDLCKVTSSIPVRFRWKILLSKLKQIWHLA